MLHQLPSMLPLLSTLVLEPGSHRWQAYTFGCEVRPQAKVQVRHAQLGAAIGSRVGQVLPQWAVEVSSGQTGAECVRRGQAEGKTGFDRSSLETNPQLISGPCTILPSKGDAPDLLVDGCLAVWVEVQASVGSRRIQHAGVGVEGLHNVSKCLGLGGGSVQQQEAQQGPEQGDVG